MVLIFHSFKGRSINFRYVFLFFQIWKTSGLEDFQTTSRKGDFKEVFQMTSRKSSDGLFFYIKWSLSLSL
uniref:Uncharacterized protein n=1 Tax=Brassica oleracea TaxID=3712 RepID=A0A3P6D448_BRAOL|nr:unnamed protein product [Brassica oleracea]